MPLLNNLFALPSFVGTSSKSSVAGHRNLVKAKFQRNLFLLLYDGLPAMKGGRVTEAPALLRKRSSLSFGSFPHHADQLLNRAGVLAVVCVGAQRYLR